MSRLVLLECMVATAGLSLGQIHAATVGWKSDAATTDWATGGNWSTGAVPGADDDAQIRNSSRFPVIGAGAGTVKNVVVGFLANDISYLTISADLTVSSTIYAGFYQTSIGTITQTAGSVAAGTLSLGAKDNTVTGTYLMQGGTLTVTAGGITLGGSAGRTGVFTHTGGTVAISGGDLFVAVTGTGTLTLRDAAAMTAANNLRLAPYSDQPTSLGTLVLDGSKTGVGTNLSTRDYTQGRYGTLKAVIDSAAVAVPGAMRGVTVTGTANFASGSRLEVGFAGAPAAGTWTLLTATTLNNNGLAFAPSVDADTSDGAGWSFSTVGNVLTVTYVAPPAATGTAIVIL